MTKITTSTKNNLTKVAPSLPGHFILRNWPELQSNKFEFMLRASQAYGDIIWVNTPKEPHYLITHPDYVQYIFQNNKENYNVQTTEYEIGEAYFGQSLFRLEGDPWLRQRRLVQPIFQHQNITHFGTSIAATLNTMLIDWVSSAKNGTCFDVDAQMRHLCINIACKNIFGIESDDKVNAIAQVFQTINKHFKSNHLLSLLLPWLSNRENRQLKAALKALDNFIYPLIAQHRASINLCLDKSDILSRFMVAQDAQTGETMSDKLVRDEAVTSFYDSSETLGLVLSWTWYLLCQHPPITQKLRAEIDTVLGELRPPTVDDLPNLPYSRMVIQESLRLYTVGYFISRNCIQDDQIGGCYIPANSHIIINNGAIHRHADFWENPNTFEPERFTPEQVAKRHKFCYLPFGGGSRYCTGNHLTMMQAQLILVTIAQRFNLKLVGTHRVIPKTALSLRPKHGIFVTVEQI